jgi:hypothetical protein
MTSFFSETSHRALALVLLAACGSPAPKPAEPSADAVKFGRVTESPAKVEAVASVSEIKKRWSLPRDTSRVMYADTQALMKTSLVQILFRDVLKVAQAQGSSLSVRQNECLTGALSSMREMAAGETDESGPLLLLRYDRTAAASADLDACMRDFVASEAPIKIAGALSAFELREMVVARDSDFYILGKKPMVEAALTQRGTEATWPPGLALSGDQNLAMHVVMTEDDGGIDVTLKGSLAGSNERFALEVEAQFKKEEEAEAIEQKITPMLASLNRAATPEEQKLASLVQSHTSFKRSGRLLSGAFELRESLADQKRDFEVLSTMAFFGVRKYISNAKTAEARNTLGQIAKDILSESERTSVPGKPRIVKLVSFPPVPKTVPSGMKVQSKPSDWKAWAQIKFSLSDPQYFQYEVKAAKDGQSAEIIARGDLNGDGKTSLFVLQIKREAKKNVLTSAPTIVETNPEE